MIFFFFTHLQSRFIVVSTSLAKIEEKTIMSFLRRININIATFYNKINFKALVIQKNKLLTY